MRTAPFFFWSVLLFPSFYLPFLFLGLVLPVGDDVEEFKDGHLPHLVPFASEGLRDQVYIRNPTPSIIESSNSRNFFSISIALAGSFFFKARIEEVLI